MDSDLPLLSVSGLNRLVAQSISQKFPLVRLSAELSQVIQAASGHWYLTLKDPQSTLRAVMFRKEAASLPFRPKEGMQVELRVSPGLYEPKGEFQVRVLAMAQAGLGSLFEKFQRLRAELEAEGLFDPSRKKPFPSRVAHIGILTSLGAAALRDVLVTLMRHAPRLRVSLFPSLVQGIDAPGALQEALKRAQLEPIDLLLVVRGGGSLEDLWAFNDASFVRQLACSRVYTVSGVGHETDITLTDLVTDHRAPTPTAAALWASQSEQQARDLLSLQGPRLRQSMQSRLNLAQQRWDLAQQALPDPRARLAMQRLQWVRRAEHFWQLGTQTLQRAQQRISLLSGRLSALDPKSVLARGYSLVLDSGQAPVTSVNALTPDQALHLVMADGNAQVRVEGIERLPDKPRKVL